MSKMLRNTSLAVATTISLGLAAATVPAQAGGLEAAIDNDNSVVWTSFADKRKSAYPTGPSGGR